jgi:hypothetical protein
VSKIRANHFSNYEIGIMLNNAIIDTEQGTPGSAWDNLWYPGNLSGDKVSGALIGIPSGINWYHQDVDNASNYFSPRPWNGNLINPIEYINSGVACDNYNRIVANRLNNFGAIVGDSALYPTDSLETRYQSRLELYLAMLRDSTIIFQNDSLDTDFEIFFNTLDTSNVGRFTRVIELISSDVDSAETMLTQIATSGETETLLKSYFTLYFSKILTCDTLSQSDSTDIEYLTQLSRSVFGSVVHDAAASIFYEIHPVELPLRLNLTNPQQDSNSTEIAMENLVEIYPNPTKKFITVVSHSEIKLIEILNAYGSLMRKIPCIGKVAQIELTGLSDGIYYVKTSLSSGDLAFSKLVVQQ